MKLEKSIFAVFFPAIIATSVFVFPDQARAASASFVETQTVQELSVGQPVVMTGFVRSRSDVLLPATVEGEVVHVLAEGSAVKKGDVIAKIDDRRLLLQLDEQRLQVSRAEISLEYLTGEVDRLSQLQQANLGALAQLAELVSRRDLASNDLQVANSRVAQLEETLERTQLVAPVDGVVVERLIDAGEFARRGDTVLRVVDAMSLEVEVLVPIAYLNRLDLSKPIEVGVADEKFQANTRSIVQVIDRSSQTFGLILDVPVSSALSIAAGQFADALIPIVENRRSLFVPRDAVVLRTDGSFVFKLDETSTALKIDVVVGAGQGELVAVSGNLREGDQVVVRGVESLQDGQAVQPTS